MTKDSKLSSIVMFLKGSSPWASGVKVSLALSSIATNNCSALLLAAAVSPAKADLAIVMVVASCVAPAPNTSCRVGSAICSYGYTIYSVIELYEEMSTLNLDNSLASRIIKYMTQKAYKVFLGKGELNIIYIEGCDWNGIPNADRPNEWNDRRILLTFNNGKPEIILNVTATTEPGDFYTLNPFNPKKGCARIAFGQYRAWQVGTHNNSHEALIQTGGEVTVHRDLDKNFKRTGDRTESGYFGINQHHGWGLGTVGRSSAGCLVGQNVKSHQDFMRLIKSDPRYKADKAFIFTSTIIAGDDLAMKFPA